MWTKHVELSWPKAKQRKINVSINWKNGWMDTKNLVGAKNWKFSTCTELCHTSGPDLSYRIKWLQLLSSSPITCPKTWATTPSLFHPITFNHKSFTHPEKKQKDKRQTARSRTSWGNHTKLSLVDAYILPPKFIMLEGQGLTLLAVKV